MTCLECVTCTECGGVALCVAETNTWPCPHFERICGNCWPGTCEPCIETAMEEVPC